MQIFLARLVNDRLIDRLSQEALVEPAQGILLVRFIDDFDEISLFKQSDGILYSFGSVGALGERRDKLQGVELELLTKDRGGLEKHNSRSASLQLTWSLVLRPFRLDGVVELVEHLGVDLVSKSRHWYRRPVIDLLAVVEFCGRKHVTIRLHLDEGIVQEIDEVLEAQQWVSPTL